MRKKLCITAALLVANSPAFADDTSDPIIVTASRTAQTADAALAAVTVITRADIERSQATSLQDLLRGTPGIDISNNGGQGKATSIFLRGADSDEVLVLVDGVKIGSATLGTASFQDIPVDQIDHIEIVRGPRSSLYGSEAIGGVIQIFTRKGGGATTPTFSVDAGTYQTYKTTAGVTGGGKHGWYNVNLSDLTTRGFNACQGNLNAGCYTIEPDSDGYRNTSGTLRGGYRFANDTEVEAHVLESQGHNMYDGSYSNEDNFVQQAEGASLRFSPMGSWRANLLAGRSEDKLKDFLNGAFVDRYNTQRDTASFQNDISFADRQIATVGLDYQNDHIDSTTAYTVTSRDNKGVFAQYQAGFGAHDLQFAMRHDDNQQFGGHNTGSAAYGYDFSKDLRLIASYGTAFRAPTFNELYYPGFGNPNLHPETSNSAEIGLRGKPGWGNWSLNAYQTLVHDMIGFDASFIPANIDTARIRGLESTASTRVAGWDINGNLTLLDPENRSAGPNQGNVLPRRAKQTARIDLDHDYGKARVGATLYAAGKRYDDLANTQELGAYSTVDLRTEYPINRDWLIQGRIANLFDRSYETAAYYNQPGREFMLTLRYQPSASRHGKDQS